MREAAVQYRLKREKVTGIVVGEKRVAIVRFGNRRWELSPGDELSFGRAEGRDLRLGHDPEDTWVSREAGTLVVLDHVVLVRNDSNSQPLLLQTFPGPEYVLEPRGAVAAPGGEQVRVVVPGLWGSQYAMAVDVSRLRRADPRPDESAEGVVIAVRATASPTLRLELTDRDRLYLAALCEPLLTLAGPAATAATYKQIGERLGRSPRYVRNRLDALRNHLAVHGVPGMRSDDEEEATQAGYVGALAMWAIRNKIVRLDDLDQLDAGVAAPAESGEG